MSELTTQERKEQAARMYEHGITPREICKELHMGGSVVYRILREYGHNGFASYELNEECFSTNSEEAMYFGGLLMADGCLTEIKPGKYNLYLDSLDRDILEKYRVFLGSPKRKIQNRRTTYRVQVSNDKISQDVMRFGIIPRKTHSAKIPSSDIVMNRHFWRGFIDGDGWYNWNNRNTAQVGMGSASLPLVEQFIKFLDYHGLYKKNKIYEREDTLNPFYSYVLRGTEAFNLIDILYFNSTVHMDRKREKAMEFMYNRNRW